MLETVGKNDTYVRNYTSIFDVKEFIQNVLIPKAFPSIEANKLNLGFTGIVSEYIGDAIEDSTSAAALMLNESFITKATIPSSIYAHGAIFNKSYSYAVPSSCTFALQIYIDDILEYSEITNNASIYRYKIDKDTKITLGKNIYKFDYDIFIDHEMRNGHRIYKVYYNTDDEINSISDLDSKYINYQVSGDSWLILFVTVKEFDRKIITKKITDNKVTTNSDIELSWTNQICGMDVVYISPKGNRQQIDLKQIYTNPSIDPFVWYFFTDDNKMSLTFNSDEGYWTPEFNSSIEATIYTCNGSVSNFTEYTRNTSVPVTRTGERFNYNSKTKMVALCWSASTGGQNRGNIENLRNDIILAYNSANALTTEHDLELWFNDYAKKSGVRNKFFKRRDDPSGKLFSQFISISKDTEIFSTNTLSIKVDQNDFDFVNYDNDGSANEFILKAGHIWEYDNDSRTTLKLVNNGSGNAMIYDEVIPEITEDRPFMFVNPFSIKIFKSPAIVMNYNYLINEISWPENMLIKTNSFYNFQISSINITRTLSHTTNNKYHIECICIPSIAINSAFNYIEGIGSDYPANKNNLRVILILTNILDGDSGYIEMSPTEELDTGAFKFETDISVKDNLQSNMIEIDLENSPNVTSLTYNGDRAERVFIDSTETLFNIMTIIKDFDNTDTAMIFNDPQFKGYIPTDRYRNKNRELNLYKPLSMMRSVLTFTGDKNSGYTIEASLIPFVKYDLPLDDESMEYFIQSFNDQYKAMEPVLSQLEGNSFLDFKLYNTYGRSNNYYVGPSEDGILANSDLVLDDVYVKMKFKISVKDRSFYSQTVDEVINEIEDYFNQLNELNNNLDIHMSNLIRTLEQNVPNIRYIRFLGFNNYDSSKQSIFIKFKDISELQQEKLIPYVPEILRVDKNSIEIIEEI